MDVFNKLYSSVSHTVSQLSGVLPGNPVTREFEATQFIASAGPGLQWKVYKGYKKSTKQEASIFVFEKRCLEKWNKGDRDIILDMLRRGVTQLTKLRHPQVLIVQHSLEESRESLAFATEPVFASLANILGNTHNMPQPTPKHLQDYKLFEVEIKYGLMQVAEGLAFLHNDVKLLHRNISPESIIVNQQGAWKIFGFDYCVASQSAAGAPPFWPFTEYCQAMDPITQPSLDFLAPENALSQSHSAASDIFSLGMLIYCLHSPNHRTLGNVGTDYREFQRYANELKNLQNSRLNCVTEGLREYVKLMLNTSPALRPDLHQFLKIPYFEDVGVKALNYLDSLFQWDNLQKSQFYKGLPQIIHKMPHRVCIYRILPCLTKEFLNPPMVPFVLPNVLLIAENSNKEEFCQHILPALRPVMTMQEPIQILLIFMQKMELLLKLTPPESIKTDILPMLYRALESDAQQIQELCLSVLPTFASLIDYPAMKNALLPRIKKLCVNTNYLSVRVNCLLCLGKLLEHLDKWLVLDEIIPFLPQIQSREPAVLMGILGIYKLAMDHKKLGITKEVMVTKVLPFLIPLCTENGLTLNQFNALITLVKQMIAKVETEHRAKLEQLNSIQNESKGIEQVLSTGPETLVQAPVHNDIDDMFASLEIGRESGFGRESGVGRESGIEVAVSSSGLGSSGLTIEDKQRLAQQQETAQTLAKQAPLQLKTNRQERKQTSKPVDLTSSLLQSNLTQLSTNRPNNLQTSQKMNMNSQMNMSSPQMNMSSPQLNMSSPQMNINSPQMNINSSQMNMSSPQMNMSNSMSMNMSMSSPMTSLSSFNSNPALTMSNPNQSLLNQNWNMSNSTNFNNKWTNNQTNQNSSKQDWSAFESLLPGQNNNQNSNENLKKLNSGDMMDLLS